MERTGSIILFITAKKGKEIKLDHVTKLLAHLISIKVALKCKPSSISISNGGQLFKIQIGGGVYTTTKIILWI